MTKHPISAASIAQFAAAIRAAGIEVPQHIDADGGLHRFSSNGRPGDTAGWYVLHLDGIPAGAFGCWRTGFQQDWRADIGRAASDHEDRQWRERLAAIRRQREEQEEADREQAATRAVAMWDAAQPATADHPYLKRKGIKPHGVKASSDDVLLVPMFDAAGRLWNLERIAPAKPADGGSDKKGLLHGKRKGCWFALGELEGASAVCIAEGFATGASTHEATGLPVAVAFNAGNLKPVAKALRAKYNSLPIIVCGDDDHLTRGNPGKEKATEAALAVGGVAVFPIFSGNRPDGATDFNDLHQAEGPEAIERIVSAAVPLPHPDGDSASEGVQSSPAGFPAADRRPCYTVIDDWMKLSGRKVRPGVYHCQATDDALTEDWICSPLHIDATTHDGQSSNFGRLLRFRNSLGKWREWAMPMEMLAGDGTALRAELLAMGVEIAPARKARDLIAMYLQGRTPGKRIHCALQVGWSGECFVLPDQVFGPPASAVIFQSGERGHEEYTKAGTLHGWIEGVSSKARGNPLLTLFLSAAFAGPLLKRCNAESGGVHGRGDSSTGKTTALEAAASVWGGANYRRSWHATSNGMEGAAALFNDGLLALDEISECDPREVGKIVYALGNGRGKQRAGRTGAARGVVRWRVMVLSTGERTIEATMLEGGYRAKAGQGVRMLDLPFARKYGAWDDLHGARSAAAFSDSIKRAAGAHHGVAGRAFLEKLTRETDDLCAKHELIKSLPVFATDTGGQDARGAARFALIALAGELATEYGLTGWKPQEAIAAAAECFRIWRADRGRGDNEARQIAGAVAGFIERHGDSRFSDAGSPFDGQRRDRAGWWRNVSEEREYLFTTEGLREALKGFDFKRGLDALQQMKALPEPQANGERARFLRIDGRGMKLYPIKPAKLAEEDHGA